MDALGAEDDDEDEDEDEDGEEEEDDPSSVALNAFPEAAGSAAASPMASSKRASVVATPATHSILTVLKAGETVHQAGEVPKTL